MNGQKAALAKLSGAMLIFGSIGVFVRHIPLSSGLIALVRAVIGMFFLLVVMLGGRKRLSMDGIKKNWLSLLLSGVAIGFNWILLFESYRHTSVAISTLCYYMAPILVVLLSPLVLKESLTGKKLCCIGLALVGICFVSGVFSSETIGAGDIKGILFGLGAACLYACAMLLNKKLRGISAFDRTALQLGIAAVVLLPYNIFFSSGSQGPMDFSSWLLLLIVGVVHTGFAYYLYFGSMDRLKMQSVAIISYLDPVFAVIMSVLFLKEPISFQELFGAALILGAAVVSELPGERR